MRLVRPAPGPPGPRCSGRPRPSRPCRWAAGPRTRRRRSSRPNRCGPVHLARADQRAHPGLQPVRLAVGVEQAGSGQHAEHVLAVGVVVRSGGVAGVVDDPVGPDRPRPDRHLVGDQVQPVAGVPGGRQVRQLTGGEDLAQRREAARRAGGPRHQHVEPPRAGFEGEAVTGRQPQHALGAERERLTFAVGGRGQGGSRALDHVSHGFGPTELDVPDPGARVQPVALDFQRDRRAENVGAGPGPGRVALPAAAGEVGDAGVNHGEAPGQGVRIGRMASRRASASNAAATSASGYTWVVSGSVLTRPEASRAIMAG